MQININDTIEGRIEIKSRYGYLHIDGHDRKIYIHNKNFFNALNNDIVKCRITKGRKSKIEAEVIEVVKRNRSSYVGTVIQINKKYAFVKVSSEKHTDFFLKNNQLNKIDIYDKVLLKITKYPPNKSPQATVIKNLGKSGDNEAEMNNIMFQYDLPTTFPDEVLEKANEISFDINKKDIKHRRDMRSVKTITIDPETAKDFDDAISLEVFDKYYEIGIHIADVSHYIKKDSIIDKEALNRGNSTYLVDRVIPMLPEHLSNGVCSLRPNEDKLTYSVIIKVDKNSYNIIDKWIGRTIINSNHRFTYEEAQDIIIENHIDEDYSEMIHTLNNYSQDLRSKRNSIFFNRNEVKFELDDNKKPIGLILNESDESHHLIEELMLLANKIVGEYLKDLGVFRNHDEPDLEKLEELKNIIKTYNFDSSIIKFNDIKNSLNELSELIKDTPFEDTIQTLLVKSMSKAEYSSDNIGHYGLDFEYYSHFTSPIRRYSDLITHRLLTSKLQKDRK